MIIYYSGQPGNNRPENILGKEATLMLTFYDMVGKGKQYRKPKASKRFLAISKARKKSNKKENT